MNIPEQIKIIDEMIHENNNSTVGDFIEVMKEIDNIAMFSCEPLPSPLALREMKTIARKKVLNRKFN